MIGQAKRLYELNILQSEKIKSGFSCPVIVFTSGKGGTGKTFVTANYSFLLAKNKKVLVVDFDQNFANLHILLNVTPKKNIYHFFNDSAGPEELIFEYNANLHFIFGESGKLDYPEFNETMVYKLISELSSLSAKYDAIIFDTSSGAKKETVKLLNFANIIYLVSSSLPTAVMDGYVILKLLKFYKNRSVVKVIMNKSDKAKGDEAFKNLSSAAMHFLSLNIHYAGNIELNKSVILSIEEQKLLAEYNPTNEVTFQIEQIVNDFANNKHVVNNSQ